MDHPRVQKCRKWAEEVAMQTKNSVVVQKVMENPRPTIYGIGFFLAAVWVLARAMQLLQRSRTTQARPSTPDLEKEKPAARSFKAPTREPGGILPSFLRNENMKCLHADSQKYGLLWTSNDQQHHQHQTGMSTPQNQTPTDPFGMANITLQWDYETWTGIIGLVCHSISITQHHFYIFLCTGLN